MPAIYPKSLDLDWYPSTRIKTVAGQLLPISDGLSRSVLEHQIELRACLLRDIELIRARLKAPRNKGRGHLSGYRRSIHRGARSRSRRTILSRAAGT